MSADDVRRVAAHLSECQPCLAEHDLDVALKQAVRRSCSGETAPAAVRLQILQRITAVRLENEGHGVDPSTPHRAHDRNTRCAIAAPVSSRGRSGVGLAAVVGLVALARATLAGALAHGVPFIGSVRASVAGHAEVHRLSHTLRHGKLGASGPVPCGARTRP